MALLLVSLVSAKPARAIPLNPTDPLQDVLGAGTDAITGGIGKLAVEAFEAIIKALFAWPAKIINRELLSWLVAVPNYAIHPDTAGGGRRGSNLAELGATTSAMAFAALGAVGTVSAIRYWAAGLTGSGGLEALEGLARTVGAALFIALWPWLFRRCADLANAAGAGLLGSGGVIDDTARMLAVAFAAGVAFNILSILIAIGAALLFLALLLTKIAVSATTAVVFVAMPLAIMVWPIPELAWIARTAMRAFATVLVIPLAWAVCFATFAALGVDALALKGAGKVVDALVMPLVAVALLWLTVVVPKTLARMALFGAMSGGGFISRTASHLAARRAEVALAQVATEGSGAAKYETTPGADIPTSEAGGTSTTHRLASKLAGAAASAVRRQPVAAPRIAAGGAATAGDPAAAQHPRPPAGGWKPPKGFEQVAGQQAAAAVPGKGLRNPSWQEIKDHVPVELAAAAHREQTTTGRDVANAMRALPSEAQHGVMSLMENKGGQIRGQMAHQAARGDLSDSERDAFRTLAAAIPEVRAEGISAFVHGDTAEQPTAPSTRNGATEQSASRSGSDSPREGRTARPPASGRSDVPPAAPVADRGPMGPTRQPPPRPTPQAPSRSDGGNATPPPRDDSNRLEEEAP